VTGCPEILRDPGQGDGFRVRDHDGQNRDGLRVGAEAEFLSLTGVDAISVSALSAGAFVVAYKDDANFGRGTAKVGTVSSGASLTASAPAIRHGGSGYQGRLRRVDEEPVGIVKSEREKGPHDLNG